MKKIKIFIESFTLSIGATTILFVGINLFVAIILSKKTQIIWSEKPNIFSLAKRPSQEDGYELLKNNLGDDNAKKIKASYANMPSPYFIMHPILHYIITPVKNPYINIGLEGARYLPDWSDDFFNRLLREQDSKKKLIFLFGGSTTMGHGVSDSETIAYYLQKLVGEKAIIVNFGAGGYDQIREIDKLEYLLRQGIKPSTVIFLDGLNDIIDMARSNYRWVDKIIYHGMSAGRGDVTRGDKAFTLGQKHSYNAKDFAIMLANSLPITRYLIEMQTLPFNPKSIDPEVNSFIIHFDYSIQEYLFANWADFGDNHIDMLQRQIKSYYTNNANYIAGLGKAFNFTPIIFYQPIGVIEAGNPYVGGDISKFAGYQYYTKMHNFIKTEIQTNKLPMIDISDKLQVMMPLNKSYIDPEHYSPQANEVIAKIYFDYLVINSQL